jgi:hypothetical protein
MLGAEAAGELPTLCFGVMDDRRSRLGQQRWRDEADLLAGARRREAQHVLRPAVAGIGAVELAQALSRPSRWTT